MRQFVRALSMQPRACIGGVYAVRYRRCVPLRDLLRGEGSMLGGYRLLTRYSEPALGTLVAFVCTVFRVWRLKGGSRIALWSVVERKRGGVGSGHALQAAI